MTAPHPDRISKKTDTNELKIAFESNLTSVSMIVIMDDFSHASLHHQDSKLANKTLQRQTT